MTYEYESWASNAVASTRVPKMCGTSISGCVRATVTDAFMRDIRCMVVRECVADRTPSVAEANFFDMDQKYADVVSAAETMEYVNRFPLKN